MIFQLTEQILGLFFMIFCSWLIVKIKILKSEDSKILSKIVLYLINPFVIISSFQVSNTDKIRKELIFSIVLSLCIHIILLIVIKIFEKSFDLNNIEKVSIIYSNSGNMVIPIVTALFGREYIIYSIGFMAIQLLFMWTHAKYIISEKKRIKLKGLLFDINMISVIIGMFLFWVQIKIPIVLLNPMTLIGSMMGPVCMIISGMLMTELNFSEIRIYKKLPTIVILRMIVIPLIIVMFIKLVKIYFPVKTEEYIYIISLIAAITPTAATITQQCQIYNKDSVYSNAIYVFTTLICVLTMPLILGMFI